MAILRNGIDCPMSLFKAPMSHIAPEMSPCHILNLRNTPCHGTYFYITRLDVACMSILRNSHVALSNLSIKGNCRTLHFFLVIYLSLVNNLATNLPFSVEPQHISR